VDPLDIAQAVVDVVRRRVPPLMQRPRLNELEHATGCAALPIPKTSGVRLTEVAHQPVGVQKVCDKRRIRNVTTAAMQSQPTIPSVCRFLIVQFLIAAVQSQMHFDQTNLKEAYGIPWPYP